MNRKILIITRGNFPFGGPTANLLRNFAKSLSLKCEVSCISPVGYLYGNDVDNLKQRSGKIGNINYTYLGFLNNPSNSFGKVINNIFGIVLPFLYTLKYHHSKKYSTFVVYNPLFLPMLSYLLIQKVFKIQLVIILPEFYEKPSNKKVSISILKWYSFYFSMKYLVPHADKFIVLSNFLKDYVKSRLKMEKPILLMPNLTDTDFFKDINSKPFLENIFTIGYVGTPTNKDGVLDLIKSYSIIHKEFPNTHLLIIGDLTNGKTIIPQLKEYAYNQNIYEKDITFTGLLPYKDIPLLLSSCQLLALTRPNNISTKAGFPSKLGEYFSSKKPVIVTKVGDLPFYFEHGKHVFFAEPNEIISMVNSFRFAITNIDFSNRVAQEGYNWMKCNLDYKNQSNRLVSFIFSQF